VTPEIRTDEANYQFLKKPISCFTDIIRLLLKGVDGGTMNDTLALS